MFYDSNVMSKEAGQERVFNIQGFPADIQISEVGQYRPEKQRVFCYMH